MAPPIKQSRPDGLLFDEADRALVEAHSWYVDNRGYVRALDRRGGKAVVLMLHREIMGRPEKPNVVDHINCDKLDCRRSNLRVIDQRLNSHNKLPKRGTRSGIRGVSWNKASNKWQVSVKGGYYGLFADKDEAAAVAREVILRVMPGAVDHAALAEAAR